MLVDTATGSPIGEPLAAVERNYGNLSSAAGFYDGDARVAVMVGQEAGGKALRRFDARTAAPLGPPEPVPSSASDDFWHQDMLHIAPDGRTLVSFLDERVRVWAFQGGRWRGPRIAIPPAFPPSAGEQFLERVTFSDDSRVASVTLDHAGPPHWATQISWAFDLESGKALSPWVLDSRTAAISPDGRSWALAREVDGSAALETRPLPDDGHVVTVPLPLDAMAQSVAWSPDSRYLGYGAANGAVAVYDTRPPTPTSITRRDVDARLDLAQVRAFPGDGRAVGAMAVTSTGRIVTVQLGVRINVRSMLGDTALLTVAPTKGSPVAAVAAGPPGTVIAGGLDGGQVVVLDQRTMTPVRHLSLAPYPPPVGSMAPAARMRVTAVGVSPDGTTVVAGNRSGALRMWRVSDGATQWMTTTTPVEQLAVSPDGRWLATLESTIDPSDPVARAHPDGVVNKTWFRLRDLRTGAEVFSERVLDQDGNVPKGKMLQFFPDSRLVAAPFLNPSLVAVYRVERPALLWQAQDQPIESTFGPIAVAFTPDSSTLLLRTESGGSLLAFDPWTGKPTDGAYREPGDAGYGNLAFSGDGQWLFSRTPLAMSVYDATTKQLLIQGLSVADNLGEGSMAVLPDGYLFAATATGIARLDIDPQRWSASACRLAGRQLSEEEWAQLLPARPYAPACASGEAAIPG